MEPSSISSTGGLLPLKHRTFSKFWKLATLQYGVFKSGLTILFFSHTNASGTKESNLKS